MNWEASDRTRNHMSHFIMFLDVSLFSLWLTLIVCAVSLESEITVPGALNCVYNAPLASAW